MSYTAQQLGEFEKLNPVQPYCILLFTDVAMWSVLTGKVVRQVQCSHADPAEALG